MNAKVNFAAKTLNMCVCDYMSVFVYVYTNICVCIVHLGINLELFKIACERWNEQQQIKQMIKTMKLEIL